MSKVKLEDSYEIQFLPKYIGKGLIGDSENCPLAIAIKNSTKKKFVEVGDSDDITVGYNSDTDNYAIYKVATKRSRERVNQFIQKFDADTLDVNKVRPFKFIIRRVK